MMFSGDTFENQGTGKRISGLAAQRNSDFNLGWDTSNSQLNNYQQRKSKDVTPKITGVMQNPPSSKSIKGSNQNYQHAYLQRQQQRLLQDQRIGLNYENQYQPRKSQSESREQQIYAQQQYNHEQYRPEDYHIPNGYNEQYSPSKQELDRAMVEYESRNRLPPSSQKSSKQNSINIAEKRVPSRPKQNMKDLIFNNVGVNDPYNQKGNNRRAYTDIYLRHN